MQHCQFFHKSKIKKGKFTPLGSSSVNENSRCIFLCFDYKVSHSMLIFLWTEQLWKCVLLVVTELTVDIHD